jgi:hypothetical protein
VPVDGAGPGFTFSVGLWHNFEQPEVIAFGLPEDVAHRLINAIADEADEGHRFLDGETNDQLLVGYPVQFVAVPANAYADHLGSAQWAYEGAEFPCVQLVWPDKQGRWPWTSGVREGFRRIQPVLGRHAG